MKGERIGVDASTMEANAARRNIVRRDTGEGYRGMLERLAQESGIETPGSPGDYGWGGVASTVFWVDPVEDMTVLFLTQLSPSHSYPNRKELRALVYQALQLAARKHTRGIAVDQKPQQHARVAPRGC